MDSTEKADESSSSMWIDDTFCMEIEPKSLPAGQKTVYLDDTLNSSGLDIPSLSALISPSSPCREIIPETQPTTLTAPYGDAGMQEPIEDVVRQTVNTIVDQIEFTESQLPDTVPADESVDYFFTAQNTTPLPEVEAKLEPAVRINCSFNLQVNCIVSYSKDTGLVLQKKVQNVKVISRNAENSVSESDKRISTSSGGSIYSDKSGLPFPLRPRISVASIQTSSTSSTDDVLSSTDSFFLNVPQVQPWKNDCLLSLACDEALVKQIRGPLKITPPTRVSFASRSLIDRAPILSPDEQVQIEPPLNAVESKSTPKRGRVRSKKLKTPATVVEEGFTPKRSERLRKLKSISDSADQPSQSLLSSCGTDSRTKTAARKRPKQGGKNVSKKLKMQDDLLFSSLPPNITIPGLEIDEAEYQTEDLTDSHAAEKLGPVPVKQIFKGMTFMLCYVPSKDIRQVRQTKKTDSDYSMSETEDQQLYERYQRCPFNASHLRKQITAGGGTVIDDFEQLSNGVTKNVYLVTNRPNCSRKFLLSVLSQIHILLHLHVIEACQTGFSRHMKLQHVGWSKANNKWMEASANINKTLEGKSVHLFCRTGHEKTDKAAEDFWTTVLKKLGAYVVKDLNSEYTEIIITNEPPPKHMQESLEAVGTMAPTIVSLEWLKDCIFSGFPVSQKLNRSFYFSDTDSSL